MDSKEGIIQATIALIEENGEHLEEITVREICKRAGVGLGLVNYHFENKDKLIEQCVERIINGIVEQFQNIREKTEGLAPFAKLEYLGNMTLDFLFEHYAVSRLSVLTDMQTPKGNDNTYRTYAAYLPLVAACRPDWDASTVKRKTFCLITVMQQMFLRHETISQMFGVDLRKIEKSLLTADLIVMTSPTYVFHAMGARKALLDHFAYRWLPHRPAPEMFGKRAVILTQCLGSGAKSAAKDMKHSLS